MLSKYDIKETEDKQQAQQSGLRPLHGVARRQEQMQTPRSSGIVESASLNPEKRNDILITSVIET